MASERPSSDMVLSVKPNAHTAMKEESTETGSARPVITVERQELRKRKTTNTVRSAPSISASSTLRTESRTRSPAVAHHGHLDPLGKGLLDALDAGQHLRRPRSWCSPPWTW